jgi:heptosyltransferase III
MSHAKSSILIFRVGSIGDTVVALPCFHAIARAYPGQHKVLLTNALASDRESSVESVLKGSGLIDSTVYFPVRGNRIALSIAVLRQLRRFNPEVLVYMAPRPRGLSVYRDLIWFGCVGIRRIIGAPLTAEARDCRTDPLTGELEFEAERLAYTLQPHISVEFSSANWDLRLSADEHAVAQQHLAAFSGAGPLLALAPAAKVPEKDWGEDRWRELIKVLQQRLRSAALVFVGAPNERAQIEDLAAHWPGRKVNLCGLLTPRECAAVLSRCDLLACHDSGPMHLAASQGTPCVALFGTYNKPHRWFPFGLQHRVIYEPRGVRQISVATVADAVESVLAAHIGRTDSRRVSVAP